MTERTYSFAYGRGEKSFTIDDDLVISEVRTRPFPVIPKDQIREKVLETIRNPIGTKPLAEIVKPGDTVAFICNDPTRVANSFDFMPVFVEELNRLGIPDENMRIVFALGTHRAMTEEEMAA